MEVRRPGEAVLGPGRQVGEGVHRGRPVDEVGTGGERDVDRVGLGPAAGDQHVAPVGHRQERVGLVEARPDVDPRGQGNRVRWWSRRVGQQGSGRHRRPVGRRVGMPAGRPGRRRAGQCTDDTGQSDDANGRTGEEPKSPTPAAVIRLRRRDPPVAAHRRVRPLPLLSVPGPDPTGRATRQVTAGPRRGNAIAVTMSRVPTWGRTVEISSEPGDEAGNTEEKLRISRRAIDPWKGSDQSDSSSGSRSPSRLRRRSGDRSQDRSAGPNQGRRLGRRRPARWSGDGPVRPSGDGPVRCLAKGCPTRPDVRRSRVAVFVAPRSWGGSDRPVTRGRVAVRALDGSSASDQDDPGGDRLSGGGGRPPPESPTPSGKDRCHRRGSVRTPAPTCCGRCRRDRRWRP